ncbi:MAG: thiamine phosphate synthase [Oscillospiraceae bacterium]|nr:thiamine phosphate synthase [Oscillospiraceae bacterium]
MSDIICVTNRILCREDFLLRLKRIVKASPRAVILREKDLSGEQYLSLAESALKICRDGGVPLVIHGHPETAGALGLAALHMPLPKLREMTADERGQFKTLGASCHSVSEAMEAQALGCTYITAGHVFDTDCKKGVPGRGLDFLRETVRAVSIPVFAIGGITAENFSAVKAAGARGACLMSSLMLFPDPEGLLKEFQDD